MQLGRCVCVQCRITMRRVGIQAVVLKMSTIDAPISHLSNYVVTSRVRSFGVRIWQWYDVHLETTLNLRKGIFPKILNIGALGPPGPMTDGGIGIGVLRRCRERKLRFCQL